MGVNGFHHVSFYLLHTTWVRLLDPVICKKNRALKVCLRTQKKKIYLQAIEAFKILHITTLILLCIHMICNLNLG